MEGQLRKGVILTSDSGINYTIEKLLGAGGQGEVYDVSSGSKHYALKWYFKHTATKQQKRILENLISKGAPDNTFLWPQDLVTKNDIESFGYIMDLRPKEYKSIVDLMKRKAEPSFYNLCKVAFNLTRGYQLLHQAGYCYRDISFGNVFFNPDNGNVLICDNDNVSANGKQDGGVYGTPRFMAPEIVIGKAKPSRNTDLFSLAVLLFYIFMLNHPLEGKLEANIKCMDIHAMNHLYGTNPLFIYDPNNESNRPVPGYQENARVFWKLYPQNIKDLFTKSFTVGLAEPAKRVTENKWLEAIANMMSGIIMCPNCGVEVFYDEQKEKKMLPHKCWECNHSVKIPAKIIIGKNTILLSSDTKIYSHQIFKNYDMSTVVGEITVNPKNPNLWGIRNKTRENWTYIKADGSQIPVASERAAAISKNAKIDFGSIIGTFE